MNEKSFKGLKLKSKSVITHVIKQWAGIPYNVDSIAYVLYAEWMSVSLSMYWGHFDK